MKYKRGDIVEATVNNTIYKLKLLEDVTNRYNGGVGNIWKVNVIKGYGYASMFIKFEDSVIFSDIFFKKIKQAKVAYHPEWM